MNTRSFIKGLVVSVVGLPTAKSKSEVIIPEVVLPEEPIEKYLRFEHKELIFDCKITDQILLPQSDGTYELNDYGEFMRTIARVSNKNITLTPPRHIKVEGPLRTRITVLQHWDEDITYIIKTAHEKFKEHSVIIYKPAKKV